MQGKEFTRNGKILYTIQEKRKEEYSKDMIYATIDAFYRRLLFIEAGRIQE